VCEFANGSAVEGDCNDDDDDDVRGRLICPSDDVSNGSGGGMYCSFGSRMSSSTFSE